LKGNAKYLDISSGLRRKLLEKHCFTSNLFLQVDWEDLMLKIGWVQFLEYYLSKWYRMRGAGFHLDNSNLLSGLFK
jgi:hypothetical protein